jgi:hypothetical protein
MIRRQRTDDSSGSLFEAEQPANRACVGTTVSITAGNDRSRLSKGQRKFNDLIKQIERKRARLAAWEAAVPPYQRKYVSEMVPLIEGMMDLQLKMVQCLDRASTCTTLTKTERRKVAGMITALARGLLAARDDPEAKAIYNRHSAFDYDAEQAEATRDIQSVLEDLGIELGDDLDITSPDDLLEHAEAKMRDMHARNGDRSIREERPAGRKKPADQLAREAQHQADEQQLRQSIRDVYRKLVSALHPDRETDPNERARKTALMQRANHAYDRNNLLQLLELQLELEHIDQRALDNLDESRLKHYNRILKDQLLDLDQEILRVEHEFIEQFGHSPFADVSPGTIMRELAGEIVSTRHAVRDMKRDLLAFEGVATLKTWLKTERYRSRMADVDGVPF